jgi:hypothetical protein
VDLRKAAWRLAVLWLLGGGVLIFVLIGQTYGGLYGERADAAWSWFLPTVMPTLSLIIGSLAAEYVGDDSKPRRLDRRLVHLATGLSAVYLLLVAVSILAAALLAHRTPSIELLQRSSLWLGPIQGLVAGSLGAIYRRAEP